MTISDQEIQLSDASGQGKVGSNQQPIRAFIGLGSNLGDRQAYLSAACQALAETPGILLARSSSLYETEPVGYTEQGWFLNQVVEIATTIDPYGLLQALQQIEQELGRRRLIRWGPRVIDLDLLLYGNQVLTDPQLTVPHSHLYERSFVLAPLNEIAPAYVHPDGKATAEHLQALGTGQKIRLFR